MWIFNGKKTFCIKYQVLAHNYEVEFSYIKATSIEKAIKKIRRKLGCDISVLDWTVVD